eukprot:CFRG3639T1
MPGNTTAVMANAVVIRTAYVFTKVKPVAVLNYLGPTVGVFTSANYVQIPRGEILEMACAMRCNNLANCLSFDIALGGAFSGSCQLNVSVKNETSIHVTPPSSNGSAATLVTQPGNVFHYVRTVLNITTDSGLCQCKKGHYLNQMQAPYVCNECSADTCRETYLLCSAYNNLICASCPPGIYGRQCDQIDEDYTPSTNPSIIMGPPEWYDMSTNSSAAGNPTPIIDNTETITTLVFAIAGAVVLALVVLLIIWCIRRRWHQKRVLEMLTNANDRSASLTTNFGTRKLPRPEGNVNSVVWISPQSISTIKKIGDGNFGVVFEGFLTLKKNKHRVAIKELKNNFLYANNEELLAEAVIMSLLHHENVTRCYGVSKLVDNPHHCFVMEYMSGGNLWQYLQDQNSEIDVAERIFYGHQIGRGMAYIAARGVVHRDLASRNVMLGPRVPGSNMYSVKLADFGLSRVISESNYYFMTSHSGSLPIRWMAPESLTLKIFNEKSDVWSFGICLWEIFTGGKIPYENVDTQNLFSAIDNGLRLKKPDCCPDSIYNIMVQCWETNPRDRPVFFTLEKRLRGILMFYSPTLGQTLIEDAYGYIDMDRTALGKNSLNIDLHPGYTCLVTQPANQDSIEQT